MAVMEKNKETVELAGLRIELERRGQGRPLLLLYGEEALELEAPFVDELARDYEVFIPSPPGFGASDRPDWITRPGDIAYLYLDLIERFGLDKVTLLGCSFGGWIAAEMAVRDDSALSRLVLVDPYGIKVGGPLDRDIQDMWLLPPGRVMELKWFEPALGKRDFGSMSEDQLTIVARNLESFARFAWEPYMHSPKLKHRLHRIKVPTLLIWGENDGIVTPTYGAAYRDLIPGAKMATIPKAGHLPHIEQPDAFMKELRGFLG